MQMGTGSFERGVSCHPATSGNTPLRRKSLLLQPFLSAASALPAFVVAVSILTAPSMAADRVHLHDAGVLEGVVERSDHGYSVVLTPASATRLGRSAKQPLLLPLESVLFVERDPSGGVPSKFSEIRSTLHDIGSSMVDRRLEALATLRQYGPGELYRPLLRGLEHSKVRVRAYCAFRLGELGSRDAIGALTDLAVTDTDPGVRDTAFAATTKIGHPQLFRFYTKQLFQRREATRLAAARALGALGDVRAVEYLVRRYAISGGGSSRGFVSSTQSTAYVRDFDVEVAQAAVIADPVIGIAQSGAVLDARVVGIFGTMSTVEKRVISESLEDLTGRRFGPNPDAWESWWKEHRAAEAARESSSAKDPVSPQGAPGAGSDKPSDERAEPDGEDSKGGKKR